MKMKKFLMVIGLILAIAPGYAFAEEVEFKGAKSGNSNIPTASTVRGDLRLPKNGSGKFPAVVMLHGSAGYKDGRGEYYGRKLNEAGIATLEVDMFRKGLRPKETVMTMSHAFGALEYLKSRPDIDGDKIGVVGWSWGGIMSLRMASEKMHSTFGASGGKGFKAYAPFYPLCWGHIWLQNVWADYNKLTGHPVKIFYGGKDGYDKPENCAEFVRILPEESQKLISLEFYPNETHGWDSLRLLGEYITYYEKSANDGKGGNVSIVPNVKVAEETRRKTVEFFTSAFAN